ncbi:hypothetical protein XELAEV_18031301mg [Xenopus laevis]|uniref:Reverse transcriptase domain-containing protein n=1 Tax=Xenopus laevis TaxID=8355 RepID=A0A974HFM9_XENLA|nr:hypothetical protein XELAEV_18031301mg [Xenopus laevis]
MNPPISIPNLNRLLDTFSKVSNFKINYNKSLNLSRSLFTVQGLSQKCPFTWADTNSTYLGILRKDYIDWVNSKALLAKLKLDMLGQTTNILARGYKCC